MSLVVPWDRLFEAATSAQERAHSPYSRFPVGAAVLTEDGQIHAGCNVENASYGLSICAEQNAIARSVAEGGKRLTALAIVATTTAPCPPCGRCRQIAAEFARPEMPVRSRSSTGEEARYTLGELLPHAFGREFL
jgi:cytidine deaminase